MQAGYGGIEVKRLRRRLEPMHKQWNDAALERPWDELPLHPLTVFALKNIFFFSHATPVQREVIPALQTKGASVIAEAPTGSGKTLAFLVPLLERLVGASERIILARNRPLLSRNIIGFVLSPSRVLAEQTYVVARNLSCRFPQNIHFVLCDEVVCTSKQAAEHIRKASRGAGSVIVATPADALRVLAVLAADQQTTQDVIATASAAVATAATTTTSSRSAAAKATGESDEDRLIRQLPAEKQALLAQQDAETRQRFLKKLLHQHSAKDKTAATNAAGGSPVPSVDEAEEGSQDAVPRIAAVAPGEPMLIILDEADVMLRESGIRNDLMKVLSLVEAALQPPAPVVAAPASASPPPPTAKGGKAGSSKRGRDADKSDQAPAVAGSSATSRSSCVDFALCGATAGESEEVLLFASACEERFATRFSKVIHRRSEDFVSLIRNRFVLCEPNNLLSDLVHIINSHSSRKHFIFFNSPPVLIFVRDLFLELFRNSRPLLFIEKVFAMHEEMDEQSRFEEYNGFLQHANATAAAAIGGAKGSSSGGTADSQKAKKKHLTYAEEKNTHFKGGWKRSNGPPPATGAILLCTDVAAFGLDVRDVDYVYHFEPPLSVESYIHRVGRVGRMGLRGTSILLLPVMDGNVKQAPAAIGGETGLTSLKGRSVVNARQAGQTALGQAPLDAETLPAEKAAYVKSLASLCNVEQWREPPGAPLTANIKAVVSQASALQQRGIDAAVAMCTAKDEGSKLYRWYDTATLATQTLLLE